MNPYVSLAKQSIKHFIKTGERLEIPSNLPKDLTSKRAGVFVSLHLKNSGKLRGCIGTFLSTKKNIAEEIVANAVAAAQDPRFPPLTKEELPDLTYQVDILSELRPAKRKDLDPKKYGLLVTAEDGRRGLLLPDIPGVKTGEEQIKYCKLKAGIDSAGPIKLEVFTVERWPIKS